MNEVLAHKYYTVKEKLWLLTDIWKSEFTPKCA